jgi:hypothetical protein
MAAGLIEYSAIVQQVESPMTMNNERRKFIAGVGAPQHQRPSS